MEVKYIIEGYDNRKGCYTITEMHGYMAVYVFDGYLRGNTYHLYPRRQLIRGEKRGKLVLSIHEVKRSLSGHKKTTPTEAVQSTWM